MSAPRLIFFMLVLGSYFTFMATSKCGDQKCDLSIFGDEIRFPFRVIDRQPEACGFPGFDVRCDGQNGTLLELPNLVSLKITDFNYRYQKIELIDPDGCLLKKLLLDNFLVNSPFYAKYYQEFAVFNCSGRYEEMTYNGTRSYDLHKVGCLSGSDYTVYAVNAMWVVSLLSSSCQWAANVSVPDEYGLIFPLNNAITLYWDEPRCGPCEEINRWCRVTDDSGRHEIQCTTEFYPSGGSTSDALVIPLGVGLPLFGVAAASLIAWLRHRRRRNESTTERAIMTRLHNMDAITGIDQLILDSYPRVVIGESGRLISPDDNSCSICLLEYQINQVLVVLPFCQHCYHAACIDQWLLLNGTCPICRVPPPS